MASDVEVKWIVFVCVTILCPLERKSRYFLFYLIRFYVF